MISDLKMRKFLGKIRIVFGEIDGERELKESLMLLYFDDDDDDIFFLSFFFILNTSQWVSSWCNG